MNSLYYLGQAFFLYFFHLTIHALVEENSKIINIFLAENFLKEIYDSLKIKIPMMVKWNIIQYTFNYYFIYS